MSAAASKMGQLARLGTDLLREVLSLSAADELALLALVSRDMCLRIEAFVSTARVLTVRSKEVVGSSPSAVRHHHKGGQRKGLRLFAAHARHLHEIISDDCFADATEDDVNSMLLPSFHPESVGFRTTTRVANRTMNLLRVLVEANSKTLRRLVGMLRFADAETAVALTRSLVHCPMLDSFVMPSLADPVAVCRVIDHCDRLEAIDVQNTSDSRSHVSPGAETRVTVHVLASGQYPLFTLAPFFSFSRENSHGCFCQVGRLLKSLKLGHFWHAEVIQALAKRRDLTSLTFSLSPVGEAVPSLLSRLATAFLSLTALADLTIYEKSDYRMHMPPFIHMPPAPTLPDLPWLLPGIRRVRLFGCLPHLPPHGPLLVSFSTHHLSSQGLALLLTNCPLLESVIAPFGLEHGDLPTATRSTSPSSASALLSKSIWADGKCVGGRALRVLTLGMPEDTSKRSNRAMPQEAIEAMTRAQWSRMEEMILPVAQMPWGLLATMPRLTRCRIIPITSTPSACVPPHEVLRLDHLFEFSTPVFDDRVLALLACPSLAKLDIQGRQLTYGPSVTLVDLGRLFLAFPRLKNLRLRCCQIDYCSFIPGCPRSLERLSVDDLLSDHLPAILEWTPRLSSLRLEARKQASSGDDLFFEEELDTKSEKKIASSVKKEEKAGTKKEKAARQRTNRSTRSGSKGRKPEKLVEPCTGTPEDQHASLLALLRKARLVHLARLRFSFPLALSNPKPLLSLIDDLPSLQKLRAPLQMKIAQAVRKFYFAHPARSPPALTLHLDDD